MHSSLLTLQISINIPHLTLSGSGAGGGGGGACWPQNGAQAAKLWLPELSANILVLKKLCPASHCPVVTCLSYELRTPFLLTPTQCLCKISFENLKHFFKKVYLKYAILAKQTVRGERGKIYK